MNTDLHRGNTSREDAVMQRFAKYLKRLLANGKEKKVAVTACSRKLITILNAMMRDNQPFKEKKNV